MLKKDLYMRIEVNPELKVTILYWYGLFLVINRSNPTSCFKFIELSSADKSKVEDIFFKIGYPTRKI